MKTVKIILLGFLFLCAGIVHALDLGENQPYDKMSNDLVTPHIKWANPYYLGRVKVLVMAPQWGHRETVELAQRLAMDYTAFMTASNDKFGYGNVGYGNETVIKALDEKLSVDYDVIVISKINWNIIPAEYQFLILEKISKGAGLVYISPSGADENLRAVFNEEQITDTQDFILTGMPLDCLPVLKRIPEKRLLKLSQFGKGRVAVINYEQGSGVGNQSLTPVMQKAESFVYYEYYHSLLAKAVLWAGKKEPSVYINDISASDSVIMQARLQSSSLNLKLSGNAGEKTEIVFVCRNMDNQAESEAKKEITLKSGINEISLALPFLKEGKHFLDVWIKKGEQTINWGSTSVDVIVPVGIEQFSLGKAYYQKGEKIDGRIMLNQALPQGLSVRLEVLDRFQRVVLSRELKGGQDMPFEFTVEYPLSVIFTAKAVLFKKEGIVQEKTIDFTIPNKDLDDFYLVIWRGGTDRELPYSYVSKLLLDQYKKYGADILDVCLSQQWGSTVEVTEFDLKNMAKLGLRPIPYMWRFAYTGADLIRKPCLTDPKYRQDTEKGLRRFAQLYSAYGPPAYTLGDENFLSLSSTDLCFSPTCLADFRIYTQKIYKDLDSLNKEWETDYKSWDEVSPVTLNRVKQKNNFAQWIDHRMHMDEVFMDIHKFAQGIIQDVDPGARVGFDGAFVTTSFTGYNWYKLMSNHKLMNVYWNIDQMEAMRSFAQKDSLVGMWYGTYQGTMSENDMRFTPWEQLFRGFNTCWWWMGYGTDYYYDFSSAFTSSLDPQLCFKQSTEEIREIKSGIGKLLLSAGLVQEEVAIHYSQPSLHASTAKPGAIGFSASCINFILAVGDLGVPFKFVSSEQIESNGLKGYKVFILPFSQAVSAKEVAAIKDFVKNGGTVISDFSSGVMDEHGKTLAEPAFSDLFKQEDDWAINIYGKGRAVCAGDAIKGYSRKRAIGEESETRDSMLKVLDQAGIKRRIKIMAGAGEFKSTPAFFFKDGNAEYACILKDFRVKNKNSEDAVINLLNKAYVYDVRDGKFYGYADKIETKISTAKAKVFALLPYKIESISLGINKESCGQGDLLEYSIKTSVSGSAQICNHVFRLEVTGPDNQVIESYTKNILAAAGSYSGVIPLALNEKTGNYKIRIKETVSGMAAEKEFSVK